MRGKWLGQELKLSRPKIDIEIPRRVPGDRANVETLIQLSENPARHALHPGVLRRPAGARDVDEDFH
jgi:hypothetical protein